MKRTLILLVAGMLSLHAGAQSVDEGIKMVQYERYTRAKEILQGQTSSPLANYYYGLAELGLENYDAASAIFSKYPTDPANMAGMARIAFLKKNKAEGMRLAQAAASAGKKKDWEPLRYAADAITYTDGGDVNQAVTWYKTALERNDNPATRIALGDAYHKLPGGSGEAMTSWEKVTEKDPKNSLAYSRIGSVWYDARKYDLALANYQKAKDADLENPLPYRDLATAYFYSGKYDLAKQNNEEFLKRSDKSCDDRVQHANLVFLTKDYVGATREMQEMIAQCGERPYMYRIIGYSKYETGDYPGALTNMNTFFAKQKDPAKIIKDDYIYMGKISYPTEGYAAANSYFEKALTYDTTRTKAETYKLITDFYKGIKNDTAYAQAGDWYGKSIAANPDASPNDYYYWGYYKYYGKKYEDAARAFEAMETKYPEQPSAPYWRGRVAAAMDPKAEQGTASPYFQKWLAIPASEKYTQKPADKIIAYRYLAINAYNKDDVAKRNEYMAELEKLDAADPVLKQLKEAVQKTGAKPKGK